MNEDKTYPILTNPETGKKYIEVNLLERYSDSLYDDLKGQINSWLEQKKDEHKASSDKHDFKVGDTVVIVAGYNEDIYYTTKVIAIDKHTDDLYLFWDCYWLYIESTKRNISKVKTKNK